MLVDAKAKQVFKKLIQSVIRISDDEDLEAGMLSDVLGRKGAYK